MLTDHQRKVATKVRERCTCKVQWRPLAIIYATPYWTHKDGCCFFIERRTTNEPL